MIRMVVSPLTRPDSTFPCEWKKLPLGVDVMYQAAVCQATHLLDAVSIYPLPFPSSWLLDPRRTIIIEDENTIYRKPNLPYIYHSKDQNPRAIPGFRIPSKDDHTPWGY